MSCTPGSTIVRTSWVCGFHGPNMVKTILRLAAEHPTLSFVDDQRGHPTFAPDLAAVIRTLVVEQRPGLFHVTNQGAVSWYEFAREVLESAGLDPDRVQPVSTADLQPPRPGAAAGQLGARQRRAAALGPDAGTALPRVARPPGGALAVVPPEVPVFRGFPQNIRVRGAGWGWVSRTRWSCRP